MRVGLVCKRPHEMLLCLYPVLCNMSTLQEGISEEYEITYVGSLSVDVDIMEQEVGSSPHHRMQSRHTR